MQAGFVELIALSDTKLFPSFFAVKKLVSKSEFEEFKEATS